jgi:hypothetical protein
VILEQIQKWLAITLVGAWVLTTLLIVIMIVIARIGLEDGFKLLSQVSGVTSGFVGVIVGYYFTRQK